MEDAKIGATFRAVRVRLGRTQQEIADAAGVTQTLVSRLERGQLASSTFAGVRRVAAALEIWLEVTPRWRGVELDRLINSAHASLQGSVLLSFERFVGWVTVPEASYSIYGERGVIDILAWHAGTRSLLIVELKTSLVDPAELVRTADRRQRLAATIARERGWRPRAIGRWIIFTDTRTNRRHVAADGTILATLAQANGAGIAAWLRQPNGPISALSFWRDPRAIIPRRIGRRNVRQRRIVDGPRDRQAAPD
jgi:DNA-binding XRE family transcriptional regulator